MNNTNHSDQKRKNVNQTLYDWTQSSQILKKAFGSNNYKSASEKFYIFFFKSGTSEHQTAIDNLYEKLWDSRHQLGPLPPFKLLRDTADNFNKKTKDHYRDHTIHPIYVCFLGLYIYENNKTIKQSFSKFIAKKFDENNKDKQDEIFISLWLLSSLYHDIGYLFENEDINNKKEFHLRIINKINELLENPLYETMFFNNNNKGIQNLETQCRNDFKITTNKLDNISGIKTENSFKRLQEVSNSADIPIDFKKYYEAKMPLGNLDHGISSALLLIYIWDSFKKYINQLLCENENKKVPAKEYFKDYSATIGELNKDLESFGKIIDVAASAIALHNINKEVAVNDLSNSKIALLTISLSSTKQHHMPLAFLLKLCDEIQDWNRPYNRAFKEGDKYLDFEDISIIASNSKIYMRYFKDEKRFVHPDTDQNSMYHNLKNNLKKYLDQGDLDNLLDYSAYYTVSNDSGCNFIRFFDDENQSAAKENLNNFLKKISGVFANLSDLFTKSKLKFLKNLSDLLKDGKYEIFPKNDDNNEENLKQKTKQEIDPRQNFNDVNNR